MNNVSVILIRPGIPGNIGAVARAMANFGFSNLILVEPKCKIDEEARNRAKHAQHILDNVSITGSLSDALKNCSISIATTGIVGTDYNILRTPVLVEDAAVKIGKAKGKIALVFGAEDTGLSNEEIEMCNYTATIPSSSKYPVINLSHAVSIFLYEISKNTSSQRIKDSFPLIEGKEKEALDRAMNSAIESVKYRTIFEKRTQSLVWKRILGKAMPTRREAFAMIGLLKKLTANNQKEKVKKVQIKKVATKPKKQKNKK